jgi:choline dehydrogenase-like flavoprotein
MPARATLPCARPAGPTSRHQSGTRDPLFATIIKAAAEVGIRHNPDYNGTSQEGIAMSQATIAAGRRLSTARCYLDPVRKRWNLHIKTEALTEGLVLGGERCTGVRYSVAGETPSVIGFANEHALALARAKDDEIATTGVGSYRRGAACNALI